MLKGVLTVCVGVVVAVSALLALDQGSSPAAVGVWTPSSASALINSTNLMITIGAVKDECHSVSGKGTLGKESKTWTFTPEFGGCTDAVSIKGAWTASDINSGEATLKTGEEANSFVIEVSACKVIVKSGSTIGVEGDYSNGTSGLERPSTLEFESQSVTVTQSPSGCLKEEVKTATISAGWNVFNLSSTKEAIDVS